MVAAQRREAEGASRLPATRRDPARGRPAVPALPASRLPLRPPRGPRRGAAGPRDAVADRDRGAGAAALARRTRAGGDRCHGRDPGGLADRNRARLPAPGLVAGLAAREPRRVRGRRRDPRGGTGRRDAARPRLSRPAARVRARELPLAALPGGSLRGRADLDLDLEPGETGPEGSSGFDARDGALGLPGLPMPLPFTRLVGELRLGGEQLAELANTVLEGPLVSARASGTLGRAARVEASPS